MNGVVNFILIRAAFLFFLFARPTRALFASGLSIVLSPQDQEFPLTAAWTVLYHSAGRRQSGVSILVRYRGGSHHVGLPPFGEHVIPLVMKATDEAPSKFFALCSDRQALQAR